MNEHLEEGEVPQNQVKFFKKRGCHLCKINPIKYCCPGCERNICSLDCFAKHKKRFGCEGKKRGFHKIKKKELSQQTLQQDVHFLNQMLTKANNTRKKISLLEEGFLTQRELKREKILKQNAERRGIHLDIVPNIFQKHLNNISFYYMKTQQIYWNWDVELYFKSGDLWSACVFLTVPLSEENQVAKVVE